MKIWHISDTHTYHWLLDIPKDIDMVIFSGDCSNPREYILNRDEVLNFLVWFGNLPIKYKVYVAGNHDTSIEKRYINKFDFTDKGIIYLENESVEIEGIKIWGSPITPEFGVGWAWNRKREKIHKYWDLIPEDSDIVISHGPPFGILDATYDRSNNYDLCGCRNLMKRITKVNPKLCLFGHIHNFKDIQNQGTRTVTGLRTIFSNGSVVEDRKFGLLSSNGNILEI